jgi:hypothetical protein
MRIVLVASLFSLAAGNALAQSPGTFTATGNMMTPRYGHTATLLLNGTVLIAGGFTTTAGGALASAELFDPETGTFRSTGNMIVPHVGHTATLLPNGQVLIVGLDFSPPTRRLEAEVYDPFTGAFSAAGSVENAQITCALATLLTNGKVLISVGTWWPPAGVQGVPPYLYDPANGVFEVTGKYATTDNLDENVCPTDVVLADGQVLTTWESWKAEVYNPNAGLYFPTGDQDPAGGQGYTGTLLTNGNILIAGGDSYAANALYDPGAGKFTPTGKMTTQRTGHASTLLPDGTVLITGGWSRSFLPIGAELYQPDTGTFTTTGDMTVARNQPTATLLRDGTVLIAGGQSLSGSLFASAEIYHPVITTPPPRLLSDVARQAAILHASTQQIVSQTLPAAAGEALEIFMTGLIDGSVIPPQVLIGGRMAELLFFGIAPGFFGLNQINVRVPTGTPGTAVPVRVVYLNRPSNEATIAVQ